MVYSSDGGREPVAKPKEKPVVRVRPFQYQPSKAELEADINVDASPEDVRDALMRSVVIKESEDAYCRSTRRHGPARALRHHLSLVLRCA